MYKSVIKPLFFRFDPERVHNTIVKTGKLLGTNPVTRGVVRGLFHFEDEMLRVNVAGLSFRNPLGLAAGFDKNAELTQIIPEVGFGFMEVGAVTFHESEGNKGRHLVRLPADQSIIVYYGLKNKGSAKILKKLEGKNFKIPVGVNIAKTNRDDIRDEKSLEDFVEGYRVLSQRFSYSTINISCPNVQDGCSFQDPGMLRDLLLGISRLPKHSPIFLKVGNDQTETTLHKILEVSESFGDLIDGYIVSNLAKDRTKLLLKSSPELLAKLPVGGISGKPISKHANDLIRFAFRELKGKKTIIGLGGVFTAQDAYEKIRSGSSLVQLLTGMIYEGPAVVKHIKKGLAKLLVQDGFKNVADAVGVDVK